MRVPLGAAHFVENEITRNFQQPRGEFGARDISARAFPDSNKDLLRDVFHVGVTAQHARDRARHQSLMPLDELLEGDGIASTHQLHEPHVVSVFVRSPLVSWIVARHRSLKSLLRDPATSRTRALEWVARRDRRACSSRGCGVRSEQRRRPSKALASSGLRPSFASPGLLVGYRPLRVCALLAALERRKIGSNAAWLSISIGS